MTLFRYTLVLFTLLSISIAVPLPSEHDLGDPTRKVFYIHSANLGPYYQQHPHDILSVVAISRPSNGRMDVVEMGYGLDQLTLHEKKLAVDYFPERPTIKIGHRPQSLPNHDFYINLAEPRNIDTKSLLGTEPGTEMSPQNFLKLMDDIHKAEQGFPKGQNLFEQGKYDPSQVPFPVRDESCLGWVYYVHSSALDTFYKTKSHGILPVVALTTPKNGKIVVVEIAFGLQNLEPNQKQLAYTYFPRTTYLTLASKPARIDVMLNGPDRGAYINIGKPRTVDVNVLQWNKNLISAHMSKAMFERLLHRVMPTSSGSGIQTSGQQDGKQHPETQKPEAGQQSSTQTTGDSSKKRLWVSDLTQDQAKRLRESIKPA